MAVWKGPSSLSWRNQAGKGDRRVIQGPGKLRTKSWSRSDLGLQVRPGRVAGRGWSW